MNTIKTFTIAMTALLLFQGLSIAEDAKQDASTPAAEAVKADVKKRSLASGTLDIFDNQAKKVRTLDLMSIKETGKGSFTGEFRDTKTGDVVTAVVKVTGDNGSYQVGDFEITGAKPPEAAKAEKKDYTDKELQDFMKEYVDTQSAGTGVYLLFDEKTKKMRKLEFVKLQEKIRRYGIIGISTAEFKDKETGDTILADLNVENHKDGLEVTAVRIKNVVKNASAEAPKPADAATATEAAAKK